MKSRELNLNRESKEMNLNSEYKGGDGFIDRSKVRILLCDNDSKSLKEVFTLLSECSYQVTSVRSARQVIDALNAEGPDIDIILAEVDLPMAKGMKMLRYITRDKDLRRIPVIMMSRQDEVAVVVKCLKLGAADYLVKPLRTNELLNLWTHMWRRRHMLGLAEKNILNYDFDLVASDPSDANTNSATLFSDDTDDKTHRSTNPETGTTNHQENQCGGGGGGATDGTATSAAHAAAAIEPPPAHSRDVHHDLSGKGDCHAGQMPSGPKRSQLKIGESSAFFTYVKSPVLKTRSQGLSHVKNNGSCHLAGEANLEEVPQERNNTLEAHENGEAWENYSHAEDFHSGARFPDSLERSCRPPMSLELHNNRNYQEENTNISRVLMNPRNESSHVNVSGLTGQPAYPYYVHGVMNQVMMQQPSAHSRTTSAMLPQYGHHHLPQCPPPPPPPPHPHPNGMPGLPYYHPISIPLQPGMVHPWPSSVGNSSSNEIKSNMVDRREAALIKFRKKRQERCFDKKIRYVNRKRLAERRPRVRGQFVRKVNGVNVDLNGRPESADYDEDEEEDDDEQASRDLSPDDDGSGP